MIDFAAMVGAVFLGVLAFQGNPVALVGSALLAGHVIYKEVGDLRRAVSKLRWFLDRLIPALIYLTVKRIKLGFWF